MLPVLIYGCETWTASEGHLSRIRAVEVSFLGLAVGLGKMEGYSNRKFYEMMNMEEQVLEVNNIVSLQNGYKVY